MNPLGRMQAAAIKQAQPTHDKRPIRFDINCVRLTVRRRTEFVLLQLAHDAEFFAAVEALHAISFIGGIGELEEAGKALWGAYGRKAEVLRVSPQITRNEETLNRAKGLMRR